MEYFLNAVQLDHEIAWNQVMLESSQNFTFIHSEKDLQDTLKKKEYVDIHEWVFTPVSFRLFIFRLREIGFITNLQEVSYCPGTVSTCEFYISLKKESAESITKGYFDLQKKIELSVGKIQEEMDFYHRLKENWNRAEYTPNAESQYVADRRIPVREGFFKKMIEKNGNRKIKETSR